jgi:sporulation protein YlmC with PRC-barrel domain
MKKLLVGIAALVFAVPLIADAQTPTRPSDKPASDRDISKQRDTRDTRPAWKAEGNVVETRDLIGTRIKNAEGKDIGEIDSLIVDPQNGRVTHAVVGLGGFLGVGEKKVVVPWSEMKMAAHQNGKKALITMDQAKLENAPRYERAARAERSPSASPSTTTPRATDTDKDGKRDTTDKAPTDPTKK